jgi:hypothetical protein
VSSRTAAGESGAKVATARLWVSGQNGSECVSQKLAAMTSDPSPPGYFVDGVSHSPKYGR